MDVDFQSTYRCEIDPSRLNLWPTFLLIPAVVLSTVIFFQHTNLETSLLAVNTLVVQALQGIIPFTIQNDG